MPYNQAKTSSASKHAREEDRIELADLGAHLQASAPVGLIDPAFRAALRAELVGTSSQYRYGTLDSPLGAIWVAYAGTTLYLLSAAQEAAFLAEAQRDLGETPQRELVVPERIAQQVQAAFTGRKRATDLRALERLTPFQRAVLAQTRRIPRGEVRSYAWIAREIGHPKAVRAVGTALARNPLPFVVPCHRVIQTCGDLGRYSGGGPETKARVLALEGVDLPHLQELAEAGLRFQGSRTTKIFCLPTCYSGKHMMERNRVFFHSEDEARTAGFRPCKLCRPAV